MRFGLVMLPLAIVGAASAQAVSSAPIELWNGFTTASTKEELKAFKASKPKRKVEIYPGCIAEMGYRQENGRLVTIIFMGLDREANCFERMYADLKRDRGTPETDSTTFGSVIGFGSNGSSVDFTSVGTVLIWREGEKKIKLIRTPSSGYNLIFTVRADKYLY
ncbi:hypothetical protein [Novosphingobium sp.]|uniref:hypothetical protein n=1 Tax=Novosphingobium sp. TaxID=1874826 RepID=UPI0035B43973